MIGTYLSIVRRWWWLVLATALVSAPALYVVVVPNGTVYNSVAVVQTSTGLAESVLDQARPYEELESRLATELEVFNSEPVAERAVAALRDDGWPVEGPEQAQAMVDVAPRGSSSLLEIVGSHPDPRMAQAVADSFAGAYLAHRADVERASLEAVLADLSTQLDGAEKELASAERRLAAAQEAETSTQGPQRDVATAQSRYASIAALVEDVQLRLAVDRGGVALLSAASTPEEPTGVISPFVGSVLAGLAALALGCGLAIVLDAWRNPVRTRREAATLFPGRALIELPRPAGRSQSAWSREVADPSQPTAAAARSLRMQVSSLFRGNQLRAAFVTGTPEDQADILLVGAALAAAWGRTGLRTVLVGDLPTGQGPVVTEPDTVALTDAVYLRPSATQFDGVWHLPAMSTADGVTGLYEVPSPARALKKLAEDYDVVVLAVPATDSLAAVSVGRSLDAVLVVCSLGRSRAKQLERLVATLDTRRHVVDGLVLVGRHHVSRKARRGVTSGLNPGHDGDGHPLEDPSATAGHRGAGELPLQEVQAARSEPTSAPRQGATDSDGGSVYAGDVSSRDQ